MDLDRLLMEQAGVVCRAQVLALGFDDDYLEARVRRNDWRRVHRGVYVDHTGPLSWLQRLWAALLFYGGSDGKAAAAGESALVLEGMRAGQAGDMIHIAVPGDRRLTRLEGVSLHRLGDYDGALHPNRRPARVRLEHAVLHVASAVRDDPAAIALLADACQTRRTTASRLATALAGMPCLPRRRLLLAILEDVASGVYSVLERRYIVHVERAHGLPRADRQRRGANGRGGTAWRDATYLGGLLVVELDGRLGHEWTEDRWADFDRDIAAVIDGASTIRLGWRQVLDPCRVAVGIVKVLRRLGWTGTPRPCSPGCPVATVAVAA